MSITRRELLAGAAAVGLGGSLVSSASAGIAKVKRKKLRFVHLTDLHIQPEQGAIDGVAMAVQKILSLKPRPDFVVIGGDHVMDALLVSRTRADLQFALLEEALKPLDMPVYSVIGNHDVFGWGNSHYDSSDPLYGKAMVEERVLNSPSYRSFDRGGYHFVMLDSIQPSRVRGWKAGIDDDQLHWLSNDLAAAGTTPTVVVSHIPILTAYTQYTSGTLRRPTDWIIAANGKEVQKIIAGHNVKAVLQGHTHVLESVHYMHTRYITGGSVCGNWWNGPYLGYHTEGFLVCDLNDDDMKTAYVPYGWQARV